MSRKKASAPASRDEMLRQQLEHLYLRRAVLDQLIDNLREYEPLDRSLAGTALVPLGNPPLIGRMVS